ncbi:ribonuclease P protein component [Phycisphaerales bacterium AB-hyl4]|uniref:Ribonuclease P protein component n=1 Tax=Natronomicrosphaera hydrolytica TaxID=3242702 RepID=A0ABV4U0Q1_9BACT
MGDGTNHRGLRFRRAQRLSGSLAFQAVFDARCRKNVGPLVFHALPNELAFNRLGLSVGRRVGSAVVRGRVKRLLREAFRLEQLSGPQGYDMVIVVRPHALAGLDDYRRMVAEGKAQVDREWRRRQRRAERAE